MGRIFLEQLDGSVLYNCAICRTNLSNSLNLIYTGFRASAGPASVFKNVVNVRCAKPTKCRLQTGRFYINDVKCRRCRATLGWRYEFAFESENRYKEGLIVIETCMLVKLNERGVMI